MKKGITDQCSARVEDNGHRSGGVTWGVNNAARDTVGREVELVLHCYRRRYCGVPSESFTERSAD